MIIKSIELNHFRNYENLNIEFDRETNILYGDNAQGKTNILESVYLCGTTKSHKGSKDFEMITFNQEESHIRMVVLKEEIPYRIDMHLKKNKPKGIAINGVPIKKASELFGIVNMVFFSPEDLNIIKNGPSQRRRFIDSELCQLDKFYLYNLASYNKIINQRNKLLKDIYFRPDLEETLEIWDNQLINYGTQIINRRNSFINQLQDIIHDNHLHLSGGKEDLCLKYEPNTEADCLKEQLTRNRKKDKKLKISTVGPHRDDLSFLISGIDIRSYGSQGQQRTAALSLKLSEIEIVRQTVKDSPILLLDDVLSELDSNRQNYLLNSIHNIQTIITCTGLDEFVDNHFCINKMYKVVNGTVAMEN